MKNNTNIEMAMNFHLPGIPFEKHGAVMVRIGHRMENGVCLTNVPIHCLHHSPGGFEWGYGGSGPADLALNICETIIQMNKWSTGNASGIFEGTCSNEAWEIHQEFKARYITNVPDKGGVISYNEATLYIAAYFEKKQIEVMAERPTVTFVYPETFPDQVALYYFSQSRKIQKEPNPTIDRKLSMAALKTFLNETLKQMEPDYNLVMLEIPLTRYGSSPVYLHDSWDTKAEGSKLSYAIAKHLNYLIKDPVDWLIIRSDRIG